MNQHLPVLGGFEKLAEAYLFEPKAPKKKKKKSQPISEVPFELQKKANNVADEFVKMAQHFQGLNS